MAKQQKMNRKGRQIEGRHYCPLCDSDVKPFFKMISRKNNANFKKRPITVFRCVNCNHEFR